MRSKKAIFNIFTSLILQLIMVVYGFVVPHIIIKQFGSDVNGLISSITQFLAYISLLESGFGPVVRSVLYKPIAEKDNKEIAGILKSSESFFRKIAMAFIGYIFILIFIYPMIINSKFDKLFTISLLVIISISTFAEYYFGMTYRLFLQADQKTYIISIIQIFIYVINILIVLILARLKASIQMIKIVTGFVFVLRPILQNQYVKNHYKINLKQVSYKVSIKQKWDGLAQHIAAVIHGNTDITVLSIFSTMQEVSVYSVYLLVVNGVKNIVTSFSNGIDASWGDMLAKGEMENLNKKFNMYEVLYHTMTTIIFTCTIVLIIPFMEVYTKKFVDANYIRPLFGFLIVVSEYLWAIRLPYSSITIAAGHFKETRIGAWVECGLNIVLSVILVRKYGLIGVTIGTIVAMGIRTIEFIYHTNRYILYRSVLESFKKVSLLIIETALIMLLTSFIPLTVNNSYLYWVLKAVLVFILTSLIVLVINFLTYKKEFLLFFRTSLKAIRRK
ncbi:MAG: polysaccharide biosynthesis C-terminal domain-containing protein [Peptoniphilaceae bacterium]|nr:polysaccharide biosynthesis C-terminal domain-containing protein [Peptoniphilaceae bacterium]MDY6019095.1 polysaccharide biosynthesis C-terminal domain-containing protein [Anaerococcus sp.]